MREKVGNFYKTDEYWRFKVLDGNREEINERANKLLRSIDRVGLLYAPILINEKWEVVDGQARLEACKRKRIPVMYIMQDGIGINECIQMNINQTNWKMVDYINSYASRGITSYIFLKNLIREFPRVPIYAIQNALDGTQGGSSVCNNIKSGSFVCSEEQYNDIRKVLEYESDFGTVLNECRVRGRIELWFYAIAFAYHHPDIDNDVLKEKFRTRRHMIVPVATTTQALEAIEKIYNDHSRNKIYLKSDYMRYIDEKAKLTNERNRKKADKGAK